MATYNGALYIREQLDSILGQTFADFELVVCDDGSSDETMAILEEYAARDSRIRVYHNTENLGFKRNFEQAIRYCSAPYIALADQDDIWYDHHLQTLMDMIGGHVLACGNSDLVDGANQPMHLRMSDTDHLHFVPADTHQLIYRIALNSGCFQGASMLMRRDFALQSLPIPTYVGYHDVYLTACACATEAGMVYTYTPITRYRQHSHNVTTDQRKHGVRTPLQQMVRNLKRIYEMATGKFRNKTDRFRMVAHINDLFHPINSDFVGVVRFLEQAERKQLGISDMRFLWQHIELATTMHSKRAFLRFWFVWKHAVSK